MTGLVLAKPALDCGLYTDAIDPARDFYANTVGLPYEELLKAGGGVHQHRYGLRGGVLKLNASRDALAEAPTGLRGLVIAGPAPFAGTVTDPDGLRIEVASPGDHGVEALGIRWSVPDLDEAVRVLVDGLGGRRTAEDRVQVASTTMLLTEDRDRPRTGPLRSRGFRYLTIQVTDVRAGHAHLLDHGATEAMAPRRLGDVAFISFVQLPGGDWLEVSQRASLTGPLPDDAPR